MILTSFNWQALLFGSEDWAFLPEVAVRSLFMFLIVLISLRILGKRSITQLSVFELGVIIGLGSAAGDPMFYKDVGIIPAVVVFLVVVSLYRFMTYLINKSEKIENLLEGEPVYLVEDGKINYKNFTGEPIAQDEYFSQLRLHSVSHLGQLEFSIIETNGSVSNFFYADSEVKWGLPILPHLYAYKQKMISPGAPSACARCGFIVSEDNHGKQMNCQECNHDEWVHAIKIKRHV